MGHIILSVLVMVAQMERRFILERQREGIERAKLAGIYRGGNALGPRPTFAWQTSARSDDASVWALASSVLDRGVECRAEHEDLR